MSNVTTITTAFYKEIQVIMRRAGYKYKRRLASAQEELCWTKDGAEMITLCGWHGTKGWSPGRSVHSLYIGYPQRFEVSEMEDYDDDCAMLPSAIASYQTKLNQAKRKILDQIG